MIPVHIAGVGMTQFGKSSQRLVEIMCDVSSSQSIFLLEVSYEPGKNM